MSVLLLKLLLTPTLIAAVSLVGRRWGPGVSGWIVGLPLTSGPVALLFALEQGSTFAAHAAAGVLAGSASTIAFCLAYSRLAFRLPWWLALPLGWLVYLGATVALQELVAPVVLVFAGVLAFLMLALLLLPRVPSALKPTQPPWWDIPMRMLVATSFVLLLTTAAPALGARLSGLLATFPIYISILAMFTQPQQGPAAVARLLRGVLLGLFAFATFFLVVALLLEPAGIAFTFALASIAALAVHGLSLWFLQRPEARPASA